MKHKVRYGNVYKTPGYKMPNDSVTCTNDNPVHMVDIRIE